MAISDRVASELTFVEIALGIIVALILTALWQRALENFLFTTLGLDHRSTFHTFVIAISFTVIFFAIINVIDEFARDIVLGTSTSADLNNTAEANIVNAVCPGYSGLDCYAGCHRNPCRMGEIQNDDDNGNNGNGICNGYSDCYAGCYKNPRQQNNYHLHNNSCQYNSSQRRTSETKIVSLNPQVEFMSINGSNHRSNSSRSRRTYYVD